MTGRHGHARSTPGRARAADGGSPSKLRVNKLPHSTGGASQVRMWWRRGCAHVAPVREGAVALTSRPYAKADGRRVAKHVCRAQHAVPLRRPVANAEMWLRSKRGSLTACADVREERERKRKNRGTPLGMTTARMRRLVGGAAGKFADYIVYEGFGVAEEH